MFRRIFALLLALVVIFQNIAPAISPIAAADDTAAPSVHLSDSGRVFSDDDSQWCNTEKYRGE